MLIFLNFINIDPKNYIHTFVFYNKVTERFFLEVTDGDFNVHSGYRMNSSKMQA